MVKNNAMTLQRIESSLEFEAQKYSKMADICEEPLLRSDYCAIDTNLRLAKEITKLTAGLKAYKQQEKQMEPLSLEQMREMHGCYVWIWDKVKNIIECGKVGYFKGSDRIYVFVPNAKGGCSNYSEKDFRLWDAYPHKPRQEP